MVDEFDPEVHLTDEEGNPVENKDGSLRKMNAGQKKAHSTHKTRKRKRKEFGPQLKLQADKRDGYVRRWFNDEKGRIELHSTQDDWEPVKGDDGQVIRRHVGSGKEAVLMEIPKEWYDENQRDKRQLIQDPTKMAEAKAGEGEYIPGGGDSALR